MYRVIIMTVVCQMKINQIFHYTRCITLKRITSLRGPSPRHCAQATQILAKKMSQRGEPCPRFQPQTSRSRDECITAPPTGQSNENDVSVNLEFEPRTSSNSSESRPGATGGHSGAVPKKVWDEYFFLAFT